MNPQAINAASQKVAQYKDFIVESGIIEKLAPVREGLIISGDIALVAAENVMHGVIESVLDGVALAVGTTAVVAQFFESHL
jgi:hypothetical protein